MEHLKHYQRTPELDDLFGNMLMMFIGLCTKSNVQEDHLLLERHRYADQR
jgi:hypothetical protein